MFGGEQAPIITPRGGSQILGWSSAESHRDKHAMLRASSLTGERPPRQGPLRAQSHTGATLGFPGRKASLRIQRGRDCDRLPGILMRGRR